MSGGTLQTVVQSKEPERAAMARINAILSGLLALVLLCLGTLLVATLVSSRQAMDIAFDREQAQIANALTTRFSDMQSDLTSVTFWDEAVEKTSIRYDRAWAEENIGAWLAEFYGVNESFLFDSSRQLVLASRSGKTVSGDALRQYSRVVHPMVDRVQAKAQGYKPAPGASGLNSDLRGQGLDESALAIIGGRPVHITAAAILPDFGRLSGTPAKPFVVVAIHVIDDRFLASLGRTVMIDELRLARPSTRLSRGEGRLTLDDHSGKPAFEVRWKHHLDHRALLGRMLPLVGFVIVIVAIAGIAGVAFVRRSTRALYVSRFEATHDELTGLANRRLMTMTIEQALAERRPMALMFIDLDRFKEINDRWGHSAGDDVVRIAAARISDSAKGAMVARFGGDEFVVLILDHCSTHSDVALGILTALRRPYAIGDDSVVLSGSVGIALAPDHATTASELMRKADLALYRAKALGKDRLVSFDQGMDDQLRARQQLEHELRRALDQGEIAVAYQPCFNAQGQPVAVEALARWNHPVRGTLEPDSFIPIAEDSALIRDLDMLVMATACTDALAWRNLQLSVNVSSATLVNPRFATEVSREIERIGFPAERLRLEVAQGGADLNRAEILTNMTELRAIGINFGIDDFGTGRLSLQYLRSLPLDSLKIARRFVAGLTDDSVSRLLLPAMVMLGHSLGLKIAAEGVETEGELQLLRAAGCDEYQGYLFGRPMACEAINAEFARASRQVAAA